MSAMGKAGRAGTAGSTGTASRESSTGSTGSTGKANKTSSTSKAGKRADRKELKRSAHRAGRGSVLRKVARAGASRRKLQSLILVLVTAGSVAAALLAAQLLAGVNAPFDQAFARQNGSELTVQYNGAKATQAQLATTAHAAGVTASAGPFPMVQLSHATAQIPGIDLSTFPLPTLTVVGRPDNGGPVDDVQLSAGHWPTAPNQIVIENGSSILASAQLGTSVSFPGSPGDPALTIVGFTNTVSQTADAWVLPGEASALRPHGTAPAYQMLYRFAAAGNDSQVAADQNAVAASLPSGAVLGSQSWLVLRTAADTGGLAIIPPFLAVFGILGVILAVVILAGAVSATIGTSARRIGVLKALGCTPTQVVRTYCVQAMIPCLLGVVVGTAAGSYGATVLLDSTGQALNTGAPPLTLWVELLVPGAALALVVATAVLAAGRAGRMSVIEALSTGHAPAARRGRRAQRLLARSPLPRSISLGLATPFTRPARAIALVVAVVFGVIAVTLAVGVSSSLGRASADVSEDGSSGITVFVGAQDNGPPSLAQSNQAVAAIKAQAGTAAYYSTIEFQMPVSGVSEDATVREYQGDASWSHFPLISGHWLTGPGQAVVPTHLLRATGLHLGSVVTATEFGRSFPLTIVGEVFDTHNGGMEVITDATAFAGAQPAFPDGEISVGLKPGVDENAYVTALNKALAASDSVVAPSATGGGKLTITMDTLSVLMTLILVSVAALGVIGSVVLDTRERVHDIGVYKALGMTPRQTTNMVLTSVLSLGFIAGVIGVPLGVWVHNLVLPLMGDQVQATLPPDVLNVYQLAELVLFAAGGIAIALLGALGPASWAGRIRTATALRTE